MALANRQTVAIRLVPDDLVTLLPIANQYHLPLFLIILGGILAGLLIGFVWEYFREFRQRAQANRRKRDVKRLEIELSRLREKTGEGKDDVLALLE
ncbi:MAG: lipopolysaccharide assembly protein LapA domain-containing protein [Paracoccaceae bacterium]